EKPIRPIQRQVVSRPVLRFNHLHDLNHQEINPMPTYDLILRGGAIYDGSGSPPLEGDIAFSGDTIAAIGHITGDAHREINVQGLAVAPGFINMLSWAVESLIEDG